MALGPLALQSDMAFGRIAVGYFVDLFTVKQNGQCGSFADHFHTVPFAKWVFDVLGSAIAFHVGPVGITFPPVHSRHRFAFLGKDHFFSLRIPDWFAVSVFRHGRSDLGGVDRAVVVFAAENENVPRAAFDKLRLDAAHPGSAVGTVFPESVNKEATVARAVGTTCHGSLAPLVFHHEMIVTVGIFRADVAHAASGYLEMTVFIEDPDFRGICRQRGFFVQVDGVPFLREQVDDLIWSNRILGRSSGQKKCRQQGR